MLEKKKASEQGGGGGGGVGPRNKKLLFGRGGESEREA